MTYVFRRQKERCSISRRYILTISRQLKSLSTEMKSYLSHTDELQKCSNDYLYYILQYENRRLKTDLQRATVEKGI